MQDDDQAFLKKLLKGLISRKDLGDRELNALLDYAFKQSKNNKQDAVDKISYLVGQNVSSTMQVQSAIQIELQKHDIENIHRTLAKLEIQISDRTNTDSKPDIKWQVAQVIFTVISFIVSIIALLKAFNLMKLL